MTPRADISDLTDCNRLIAELDDMSLRRHPEQKEEWQSLLNKIAAHPALPKLSNDMLDILYNAIDNKLEHGIDEAPTFSDIQRIYKNSGCRFSYFLDQLITTYSEREDIFFDTLDMIAAASAQSGYNGFADTMRDCLRKRQQQKTTFTQPDFERFLQYCRQLPPPLLQNNEFRQACLLTIADLHQKYPLKITDWPALLKLCANPRQKADFWAIDRLYHSLMTNPREERDQVLAFIRRQTASIDLPLNELPAASRPILHILATTVAKELRAELRLSLSDLTSKPTIPLARHLLNLAENLRGQNAITPQEMLNLQQTIDKNIDAPILLDFPAAFDLLPANKPPKFLQTGQQIFARQIAKSANDAEQVLNCCRRLLGPNGRRPDKAQFLQTVMQFFAQRPEIDGALSDLLPLAKAEGQIEAYFQLLQRQSYYIATAEQSDIADKILLKLVNDADRHIPPAALLDLAERNLQNYPQYPHPNFAEFAFAFSEHYPEQRSALTDCIRRNIRSREPNVSKSCVMAAGKVAAACFPADYLDIIRLAPQIDSFYITIFANLNRQTALNPDSTDAVLDFINRRLNIAQKMGQSDFIVFQLEGKSGLLHNWQEILLRAPQPNPENLQQFLQICQFSRDMDNRMPSPALWQNAGAYCRQKYAEFSDKERDALIWSLYKSPLLSTEKKLLVVAMMQTPKNFTPADYIAVRNRLLGMAGLQKEEDIETFAQEREWLLPAAIACAQIYGKDFSRYFEAIENYNRRLPKLQSEMALKEQIYAQKIAYLSEKYQTKMLIANIAKNLPDNRHLAQIKIFGQTFLQAGKISAESRQAIRNWQRQIKAQADYSGAKDAVKLQREAQSILGSIFGIANYIDYRRLAPIDMEKATAWMQKINPAEAANIRRYFDRNLVAQNTLGQTFLRLDAPHYRAFRIQDLEDAKTRQTNPVFSDDFSLLANRLRYITPQELDACKYGEIYERLTGQDFCAFVPEFCRANSPYLSSQEDYEKAERIYLAGCLTPSRFSDLPTVCNQSGTYRCYVAKKDDVRPLFIGATASCCQKLGDDGGSCAIDSVVNPYSGCLVFEKKVKDNWQTCGCSWFYESQKGDYKALTFDSLELSAYRADEDEVFGLLQKMSKEFADKNYAYINLGCRLKNWLPKQPPVTDNNPLPEGYSPNAYTDANIQKSIFRNYDAKPEAVSHDVIYSHDIFKLSYPEDENFAAAENLAAGFGSRCLRCKSSDRLVGIAAWNRQSQTAILATDRECAAPIVREFTQLAMQQLKQAGAEQNWDLRLPASPEKKLCPATRNFKERD